MSDSARKYTNNSGGENIVSVVETKTGPIQDKGPTLVETFEGQTVLVTGAAGFLGTALLYRLVDPSLRIRRVFALIRKERGTSRLPEDLNQYIVKVDENGDFEESGLIVVLHCDCSVPGFGLSEKETKWLREVNIVINSASFTRFTLSLPKAVKAISDIAYSMCHFTLNNPNVRTHMHISTCFTGWFLPSGSVVREELVPAIQPNVEYEEHANTYLHAKSIAEGVVNAIGRPPSGKTTWRIVRISTLGPAMSFPTPGWGAGHVSSPVCAGIAAEVVNDPTIWLPQAELDVIPIDIAVNQLLGLTAAAHHTGAKNPLYPLRIGNNVPIYHVAAGDGSPWSIPMAILNKPNVKLDHTYISAENLIAAYRPMLNKVVCFDTFRTRRILGLPPYPQANTTDGGSKHIRRETTQMTDAAVDVKGYEVDLDDVMEKEGGWVPYLQLVRDRMEKK